VTTELALPRTFCLDWPPEYQRCLAHESLFPQLDSAHVLAVPHIGHVWNPNDPADIR
jgi:hypothetical protein